MMKTKKIFLGNTEMKVNESKITGEFIDIGNEKFYRIANYHHMPDFFMSIVSDSDHWMFISSNGSLSAGRKNRDSSLFPYYTVDKIHDYRGITGSKTIFLVEKKEKTYLWEAFSPESAEIYNIQSNLYKSIYGNKLIFEEINLDLELSFQYGWYNSDKYGFVKKSMIKNLSASDVSIRLLDGITNILPYGLDYSFQNEFSNLLDAYKKNELLKNSTLAMFILSSIPVDRAEPSEALKATTVWSSGLEKAKILISDKQLENFKKGFVPEEEYDIRASRGAYFVSSEVELKANKGQDWVTVAEVNQDSNDVNELHKQLTENKSIEADLNTDIQKGTEKLVKLVAQADGLQLGNEDLSYARHFANTMFNIMRGGIFIQNYDVDKNDFGLFVKQTNQNISKEFKKWIDNLPAEIAYPELNRLADETGNYDLIRIANEYLPLTFSRRHGDPSRPWNRFSIETKNDDGSDKLNYEGNWRDIFQNWEALSLSFPEFIEGMISKFVNASTPDGYNPYRITREGIDWERPDPDDPWAYIGYWGDHQIIYLQKFLELSKEFHPVKLDQLLSKEIFVYANVPYRIKSYEDIVRNPQDTIEFNKSLDEKIRKEAGRIGADARLLMDDQHKIFHVNLTEKILVTLLAKLSNFIPEAGIWLNTQRPEWNDANNALVGSGVSMVTLYYLRRFLKFWSGQFNAISGEKFMISEEVKTLLDKVHKLFEVNAGLLDSGFSDAERRRFTDVLGKAGSDYRNNMYENSFSGNKKVVTSSELRVFTDLALKYMDQSIKKNKREDGLYHAYNLISFSEKEISIRYLYEMLEGQVALLSAGYLGAKESLDVMDALKKSSLFRADQYSYILYPNRQLPRFIEKNNIPEKKLKESRLLSKLIEDNERSVVSMDKTGKYHFNGRFRNADILKDALTSLKTEEYIALVKEEQEKILNIYEEMFDHQSFTGRSGTFYGYEGLGSIYWHMVSKLLLAVQENYFWGLEAKTDPAILGRIKDHYYEIKAGIGLYKSPELYGAFPTDPYSHTPAHAGAQQPGMTGQVKEDFLSRMAELGLQVRQGEILFVNSLINENEFMKKEGKFEYYNLKGEKQNITLRSGQLGFTICQVPIIYSLGEKENVSISFVNGEIKNIPGKVIPGEICTSIFNRNGEIELVEVSTGSLK